MSTFLCFMKKQSEKYYRIINSAEEKEKNGDYQKATDYYNVGLKMVTKENNKEKVQLFHNLLFSII